MSSPLPPLILVSADIRELDSYRWHAAIDTYVRAIMQAGGLPVIVPALGEALDIASLIARADGVLVTGSRTNVHPAVYGEDPTIAHQPYDHDRDSTTLPLIRGALDQNKALLAICRGHQELNVAMGGTLATDIHTEDDRFNHLGPEATAPVEERFANRHEVKLQPGGELANILQADTLLVNSVHKQAIARLGDGLTIEATADDGTIEAISVTDARSFALGVQWHPEYWASQTTDADPPSTALFDAFVSAARGEESGRT